METSAMALDNLFYQGEAQTVAIGLGCEEGVFDVGEGISRYSRAGIDHLNRYLSIVFLSGYLQKAAVRHCFDTVFDQV